MTTFYTDLVTGLGRRPKSISSKYLYDARGSWLFEQICQLPTYYVTRVELGIMRRYAATLADMIDDEVDLIELGSGASQKTRILLQALPRVALYVPVDISREQLQSASESIRREYPRLNVQPVCADFAQEFTLPERGSGAPHRALVYFPGSTLGNFTPQEARRILASMRRLCGAGGVAIIGLDLKKDPGILHRAYNDEEGVTAAFNLNLLERANRELGCDFDVSMFRHYAFYNPSEGRIEMCLLSMARQSVTVGPREVVFELGEPLVTEFSYKYSPQEITALCNSVGFSTDQIWIDQGNMFAVACLSTAQ